MSKVVVVEIEVDEDDKTAISEIAADLGSRTILSIGFKRPETTLHGHKPGCRDAAVERGLVEATQEAIRRQL